MGLVLEAEMMKVRVVVEVVVVVEELMVWWY